MAASRTERLLAFALVLINANRPLSRSEIRDAVRDYPSGGTQIAFERMFERDKDELRSMGLPIQSVEIDEQEGVGYLLTLRDAFLAPIDATESEVFALAIASRMWQEASWSHAATTALRKLELVGGFVADSEIGFSVSVRVDSASLTALLSAAQERRLVTFSYRTADNSTVQERKLHPWGVVAARGQWYAVGHDVDREDTRAFRMSRIDGKITVGKKAGVFPAPPEVDLRALVLSQFDSPSTIDARVQLAPGQAARLRQLATSETDGIAEFVAADPAALRTEILRAGAAVRVLEPKALADAVTADLRRLAETEPRALRDDERTRLEHEAKNRSKHPIESSGEQLGRLLALVPWLRAHPGTTYAQAAAHFHVGVDRLQKDLQLAVCTEFGTNLLTLDIDAWGETIQVRDPQGIQAPLQFTEQEAFSLLVGLDLLVQLQDGPHNVDAVASVSEKLRAAVGSAADLTGKLSVDATIREQPPATAAYQSEIQHALTDMRAIELEYLSSARDAVSRRVVDPMGLLTTDGATYLQAWCREAEAVRLFRLDRVSTLTVLDTPSDVPAGAGHLLEAIDPKGEVAIVELEPSITWWADQVPHMAAISTEGGTLLVQLHIGSTEWAVRTAMGFGGQLQILEPMHLAEAVRLRAANSVPS